MDYTVLNVPLGPNCVKLSFLCMCVCMGLADNCDLAITEFVFIYKRGKEGKRRKKRSRTTLV